MPRGTLPMSAGEKAHETIEDRMDRIEAEMLLAVHRIEVLEKVAMEMPDLHAKLETIEMRATALEVCARANEDWQRRQNGSIQRIEVGIDKITGMLTAISGKVVVVMAGLLVSGMLAVLAAVLTRL